MKLPMKTHNRPGRLITFCGLDGCGKSTLIALLKTRLNALGYTVALTKQPTPSVRQSSMFRSFMDRAEHDDYDYRALSLLCASDRVQHVHSEIIPLLDEGKVVLCDRYYYSCLANLRARGYGQDMWIVDVARSIPRPDAAVFLDIGVQQAVARVRSRPDEADSYIPMSLQYRLREQYREIARENGGILLDSSRDPDSTFCKLWQQLTPLFTGEKSDL